MVSRPIKPTVQELGIDIGTLAWRRSGQDDEAVEVAFIDAFEERWVLMRLAGDSGGPVHVFDTDEWDCFVEAAKHGEFDDISQGAVHRDAPNAPNAPQGAPHVACASSG